MRLGKTTLMALGLIAGIAGCATAWAQATATSQQTSPESSGLTLKVFTKLTVEDVTVTDSKGMPVHGLTQSDFTVKEDGKPQPILNFDEYGTQVPSAQPALPALPPNIYTNAQPPAPTTSAVNILLIDALNTSPPKRMYVRQQALSYLKKLPPGTRVAILELQDKLHILQGFTSDQAVLLAAMDKVTPKTVFDTNVINLSQLCQLLNTRSQLTVDALDQIAGFVSGIKGRKNLIWFTTGLPQITWYKTMIVRAPAGFGLRDPIDLGLEDYTPELHKAYSLLTAAQVALYPIDPHGLVGPLEEPGTGEIPIMETDLGRSFVRGSLQEMADATGGAAYYNRNDLDTAMGEAIATGSDYYALSYTPPLSKYDGKYHTIDVKVDRPGLHLQYRKGYTSLDLAKLTESTAQPAGKSKTAPADVLPPAVSEFRAAMGHGVATSTQMFFDVRVQPSTAPAKPTDPPVMGSLNPTLKGKPLVRYDFQYTLPAGQITFTDAPDGTHKASVEFDIVAYGEDGTKLNVLRQPANLTLKPDDLPKFLQRPFQVPLQLDLPPGKIFVRVGILDGESGKIGTLEIPQTVTRP